MSTIKPPPALLRAPHRLAFLPAAVLMLLSLAGWSLLLWQRQAGHALALAVPASQAHGFLMLYGFFPLFMTGFILTAGPRWLGVPSPARPRHLPIPLLYAGGLLFWLAGLIAGSNMLLHLGWLAMSAGWALLTLLFGQLLRQSQASDRWHARAVLVAFILGLAGLLAAGAWLFSGSSTAWALMRDLALWGFLLPVFITVSHRMLPFFSSTAIAPYTPWRPWRLLVALLSGSVTHGLLNALQCPTLIVDLPMALLCLYTSWCWQCHRSLQVRLLAMLHLAFLWLGIGFALFALQGILQLFGQPALGLAPLHAITVGFFINMVLAFVSRVSLGHAGLPLEARPWLWRLYQFSQLMALLRVLCDLLPSATAAIMLPLTAGGLAVGMLFWCRRFLPVYLLPRADGKDG
ncbi:MAG: NnrS family protein [Aquitalea sp.]|nr:NnrS family protein [Aquitalea sp.]